MQLRALLCVNIGDKHYQQYYQMISSPYQIIPSYHIPPLSPSYTPSLVISAIPYTKLLVFCKWLADYQHYPQAFTCILYVAT